MEWIVVVAEGILVAVMVAGHAAAERIARAGSATPIAGAKIAPATSVQNVRCVGIVNVVPARETVRIRFAPAARLAEPASVYLIA